MEKLRVYFTIDTETTMGGAWRDPALSPLPLDIPVFGVHKSRLYGIPLIMDLLEEHGFRGTFFTEVFCGYLLGHDKVEAVFRAITGRGHDAQLHLHPTYRFYRDFLEGKPRRENDLMFRFTPEEQTELIADAVRLFRQAAGKPPRAYRAGCYGASETTLAALRENGIEIDSSYNLTYLGSTCGFETPGLNAPARIEGVYEFPITVFSVAGSAGCKPLEISAVSAGEVINTIQDLLRTDCRDVILSFHSFSFLKDRGGRFERCTPDNIVIQRFRRLCGALSEMRDQVQVRTLGEIDLNSITLPERHVIPSMGFVRPAMRKIVQGVNRLRWV